MWLFVIMGVLVIGSILLVVFWPEDANEKPKTSPKSSPTQTKPKTAPTSSPTRQPATKPTRQPATKPTPTLQETITPQPTNPPKTFNAVVEPMLEIVTEPLKEEQVSLTFQHANQLDLGKLRYYVFVNGYSTPIIGIPTDLENARVWVHHIDDSNVREVPIQENWQDKLSHAYTKGSLYIHVATQFIHKDVRILGHDKVLELTLPPSYNYKFLQDYLKVYCKDIEDANLYVDGVQLTTEYLSILHHDDILFAGHYCIALYDSSQQREFLTYPFKSTTLQELSNDIVVKYENGFKINAFEKFDKTKLSDLKMTVSNVFNDVERGRLFYTSNKDLRDPDSKTKGIEIFEPLRVHPTIITNSSEYTLKQDWKFFSADRRTIVEQNDLQRGKKYYVGEGLQDTFAPYIWSIDMPDGKKWLETNFKVAEFLLHRLTLNHYMYSKDDKEIFPLWFDLVVHNSGNKDLHTAFTYLLTLTKLTKLGIKHDPYNFQKLYEKANMQGDTPLRDVLHTLGRKIDFMQPLQFSKNVSNFY